MAQPIVQVAASWDPNSLATLSAQLGKSIDMGLKAGFGKTNIDRSFSNALGNMTGATRNFDQVLQAANKRVIGFGISIGLIGGSIRVFRDLISATRDVDASMAKLGSVVALTAKQSQTAFKGLFDIARQTGESFNDAADALSEFSKQGGTLEQNLKKTQAALALAKVGHIGVMEAVQGSIAAYNTFKRSGEDYVTLVNKISAANRTTAIGANDLLEGLGKIGSEAQDAGVPLNKLIGIMAALKATTGQAGSSVASSLQNILGRLQNNTNLDKLSLIPGLNLKDNRGQYKEAFAVLDELARKYNTLNRSSQNVVSQTLGGQRSGNTTKALLTDLNNAQGIAARTSQALNQASGDLNSRLILQTNQLDQSIKNLGTTAKEVGSVFGKLTLAPVLNRLVGGGNELAKILGDAAGTGIGQGILKGIGNVLAGPGLVVATRIIAGTLAKTIPEVTKELKQAGGFGGTKANDQAVLSGINRTLNQATEAELNRLRAAQGVAEEERVILGILERQAAISASLSGAQIGLVERVGSGSLRRRLASVGGAAGGYVPGAISAENMAISQGVGGAPSSARSVYLPNVAGGLVANTSEFMAPTPGGTAIYNRDMISRYGLPRGSTPVAAGGFVPNLAGGGPALSAAELAMRNNPTSAQSSFFDSAFGSFGQSAKVLQETLRSLSFDAKAANEGLKGLGAVVHGLSAATYPNPGYTDYGYPIGPSPLSSKAQKQYFAKQQAATVTPAAIQQVLAAGRANTTPGQSVFIPPTGPIGGLTPPSAIPDITTAVEIQRRINEEVRRQQIINRTRSIETQVFNQRIAEEEARVRQVQQEATNRAASARSARQGRYGQIATGGYLAASIGAGFLSEGVGGTLRGQQLGAASGALQGFGLGGFIGGPYGAAAGAVVGGAYGFLSKKNASLQELAESVNQSDIRLRQPVSAGSDYIQAINALQDAKASGATPSAIARLQQDATAALVSLPPALQKKYLAAGVNPQALSDLQGSQVQGLGRATQANNALTAVGAFANAPSLITSAPEQLGAILSEHGGLDNSFARFRNAPPPAAHPFGLSVAQTFLDLFNHGDISEIRHRNPGSVPDTLATKSDALRQVRGTLSLSGRFDSDQINSYISQLSKLDVDTLFHFLAQVGDSYSKNREGLDQAKKVADQAVNIGAIKDSIERQIQDSQDKLGSTLESKQYIGAQASSRRRFLAERSAGFRQYLTQATGQRVNAASRILGSGRGVFGGKSLDSIDLEGNYSIQAATAEGDLNVARARQSAQEAVIAARQQGGAGSSTALVGAQNTLREFLKTRVDILGGPGYNLREQQIGSASDAAQLRAAGSAIGFDGKKLDKLISAVKDADSNTTRRVKEAQDDGNRQIQLAEEGRKRQIQLAQDAVQLQRLELDATRQAALLTKGVYNLSSINQIGGGPQTGVLGINNQLRQSESLDSLGLLPGSNTSTLQTKLRLKSTTATLQALASRALGRPVGGSLSDIQEAAEHIGDKELGARIYNSADNLRLDPVATAQAILNKPGSVGLSSLSGAVTGGQLSLGDAKIVANTDKANTFLERMANAISPAGADPNSVPVSLDKAGGTPVAPTLSNGPDLASILRNGEKSLPAFGVSASSGFSAQDDQSHPLTGFTKGAADSFQEIGAQAKTLEQIGSETASNLTSSFSSFFSALATGADRGRNAFRQFASSLFADESKLFSQSAIQQLFGATSNLFNPAIQSFTNSPGKAMGGYIGLASGGSVPVMLTGGEYVFTPDQARRIGPRALSMLNSGGAKGYAGGGGVVQGGSGVTDDVPGHAAPGSFVIKKSMVSRYGAGYLDSLASGRYATRDFGGYLGIGALVGGLIGAIADKKNRAQGFLIGAGAGALAGGLAYGAGNLANGQSFFGGGASPISSSASYQATAADLLGPETRSIASSAGGGAGSVLGGIGAKVATAGILAGVPYLLNSPNKVLDTPGIERNAVQVAADQQGYINNRPAGSFVNQVKGPDGRYNIIDYNYTAPEYRYSDGGSIGGTSNLPVSSALDGGGTSPTVAPVITIHNYGNGNVQGSATAAGGDQSNPFATQAFADLLNNRIKQTVQEQLVEASRPGGANQTRQRYITNPYAA